MSVGDRYVPWGDLEPEVIVLVTPESHLFKGGGTVAGCHVPLPEIWSNFSSAEFKYDH